MKELEELAKSNKPWAATRAQLALEFAKLKELGSLSDSEYQELLEDLVRTDALEAEADDVKTKALLLNAISAISKLA